MRLSLLNVLYIAIQIALPIWADQLTSPFPDNRTQDLRETLYGHKKYDFSLPFFRSLSVPSETLFIVVEKLYGKLTVFHYDEQRGYQVVLQVPVSTGKDLRPKEKAGDHRTPEGLYLVETFLSHLPKKLYGRAAYVLNYPHPIDHLYQRDGHGIWIHATDNIKQIGSYPFDSQGCVVLHPDDLARLKNVITFQKTPVILTGAIESYRNPTFSIQDVRAFWRHWLQSWTELRFDDYKHAYHARFQLLPRFKTLESYLTHKSAVFSLRRSKGHEIQVETPVFVAFDNYALITFIQTYKADQIQDKGQKTMYILHHQGEFKIVSENWHPLSHTPPPVVAAVTLSKKPRRN